MPQWQHQPTERSDDDPSLPPARTHAEREAVTALLNLSNHLLATPASKTLMRLKTRQPTLFSQSSLFYRALYLLDHNHYRLPVRRYIHDLFSLDITADTLNRVTAACHQAEAEATPSESHSTTEANGREESAAQLAHHRDEWPSGQSSMLRGNWSGSDQSTASGEPEGMPKLALEAQVWSRCLFSLYQADAASQQVLIKGFICA